MFEKTIPVYPASAEAEFMLRLALREKFDTIPEGLDWELFRKTMSKHRIYPLVIRGLRQFSDGELEAYPALKYYHARGNYYVNGSIKRMQTLASVAKAMADAGIPMLSMKGPLLSLELYGDPSMRHSHDLDVLVAAEDYLRAAECLKGLGFIPTENPHLKTPKRLEVNLRYTHDNHGEFELGDQCVELHWRSTVQSGVGFDELWERREKKLLMGVEVYEMGRRDRLPHLFAHAANHGFARMRWLLDLYEFQRKPGFSWEELLVDMRTQGNSVLLLETLLVLQRWQVIPMDEVTVGSLTVSREGGEVRIRCGEELREEAERALMLSDLVFPLMQREFTPEDADYCAYQKMLPNTALDHSLGHRILAKLQPNAADYALIDLPDRWFWLYYLIRPVYLLWRTIFGGKE